MKKLILTASFLVTALAAFGQGQVIFQNASATTITNSLTGLAAAGSSAQDDTQVALYIGNVGDAVSSLTLIGSVTNASSPGRFAGGTRTLTGWTGTVQLQVRAWLASTVYPTYEAAYAAGLGGDASVVLGVSAPINFATTQPPTLPVSLANAGLTPIVLVPVTVVPEPSSIALGLLGLGAVALFRRRK
jgi:hypothetical protein